MISEFESVCPIRTALIDEFKSQVHNTLDFNI